MAFLVSRDSDILSHLRRASGYIRAAMRMSSCKSNIARTTQELRPRFLSGPTYSIPSEHTCFSFRPAATPQSAEQSSLICTYHGGFICNPQPPTCLLSTQTGSQLADEFLSLQVASRRLYLASSLSALRQGPTSGPSQLHRGAGSRGLEFGHQG